MNAKDKEWHRGYACCLATAVRTEGCWGTEHVDLLNAVGIDKLREAEIAEQDAEVIFNPKWSRRLRRNGL